MHSSPRETIEEATDGLSPHRADQLREFWARGAAGLDVVEEELARVVCVLVDSQDAVVGASAAREGDVALVGGRRFWLYSSWLARGVGHRQGELITATFDALERRFDPATPGPIGLCAVITDPEEIRRRPEAEWWNPRMLYVGRTDDGGQVRVAYFAGASVARARA